MNEMSLNEFQMLVSMFMHRLGDKRFWALPAQERDGAVKVLQDGYKDLVGTAEDFRRASSHLEAAISEFSTRKALVDAAKEAA